MSGRHLLVGPFNRVEGDLEVRLDIADGVVRSAQVVRSLMPGSSLKRTTTACSWASTCHGAWAG